MLAWPEPHCYGNRMFARPEPPRRDHRAPAHPPRRGRAATANGVTARTRRSGDRLARPGHGAAIGVSVLPEPPRCGMGCVPRTEPPHRVCQMHRTPHWVRQMHPMRHSCISRVASADAQNSPHPAAPAGAREVREGSPHGIRFREGNPHAPLACSRWAGSLTQPSLVTKPHRARRMHPMPHWGGRRGAGARRPTRRRRGARRLTRRSLGAAVGEPEVREGLLERTRFPQGALHSQPRGRTGKPRGRSGPGGEAIGTRPVERTGAQARRV